MRRVVKWVAVFATIGAAWTVFAPGLWHPGHSQVLTNVLLGEFAALALGHTAYRLASGTDPLLSVSLGGALIGVAIAVSPLAFGLVYGLTTSNMVCGGLVAAAGVASAVVARTRPTGRESRRAGRSEAV